MKIQDPAVRAHAMRITASATPPSGEETVTVTVDGPTVDGDGDGLLAARWSRTCRNAHGVSADCRVLDLHRSLLLPSDGGGHAAEDLGPVALDEGQEHVRAGLAQAALGGDLHGGAEPCEVLKVLGRALTPSEHLDALEQLDVADAARGALPAGLVDEEPLEVLGHLQHVAVGADDDHGAAGPHVLVADRTGERPRRDTRSRGAADDDGPGVLAPGGRHDLRDAHAEGELVHPGTDRS